MSVICFGELLIDFVALENGVTVDRASGFEKAAGGAPANVAVGLARLGHQSAFVGQVGDDPFGHYLGDVLKNEGVDVDGLRFHPNARTALAFVSLTENGERSFVFYRHPSADMLMTADDVSEDVIQRGKIFHFGSLTLIANESASATHHAVQVARETGLTISYDPNLRLALWDSEDDARQGLLAGFEYAHIVKISEEEVQFLTGTDSIETLWRDPTQLIVVTHGANGATAYHRKATSVHVAGFAVNTVDTTGAGDSFVAGLLSGILQNPDDYHDKLEAILRFANACGALTTTARGAIPALPTVGQVADYLKGQVLTDS
jgi:fructokinase